MKQKIMKIFCSLAILMTVFLNVQTTNFNAVTKEENVGYKEPPFKTQLDSNAIIFYNALQSLYKDGKMKTGVGSYDLSKSFDYETLNKYANGDNSLAKAFQSARDAFVMDNPEIFYVDFSKVTLRLGIKNGTYILYVNNGSNENYFTSSFSSEAEVDVAIAQVNEKKNQIKASLSDTTLENPASIITALHNKLIENTEYTYPSKDSRNVSNVYGTLVDEKANCDGYSRTLKWILDDYNITNVLVAGVAKNARYEESDNVEDIMNEYHQWNYVKLDGKWYAVDVTWDDPIKEVKATNTDIRTTYLLRGSDMLNENHFPMGAFSEGGQEFKYPELDKLDYGVLEKDENVDLGDMSTDLKVYISKEEFPDKVDDVGDISKGTRYIVNYKNMTYEQIAEQGMYVAVRFGLSDTDFGPWEHLDAFENNPNMDLKNLFDATVFVETTIQFCITKIDQPVGAINYGELDLSQEGNHVVLTQPVDAPYYQNFTPPPFIRTSSPALTGRILPEKTHYSVEYYEELEIIDASKPVSIKINNTATHINAKVKNITYKNSTYKSPSGKDVVSTIVEFDFTPDSSFQGYENIYRLQIENMQGVKSKKIANDIPIITTYTPEMPCPISAAAGGPNSAFVMSNPVLVANEDMANEMFQDKNGNTLKYGNLNIALVASKTTGTKKENLDNVLGDKMSNAKASSTFELSLGCGPLAAALRQGYQVSVGIPYPEGFHPEDYKDVEFRAYHFKMVDGKWVSEEIVCQITPQGLMIIADSFSPFTIVAYEKEQAPVSELKSKSVNVTAETKGGTITTNNGGIGTYAVEKEGNRTFTVTPNDGYIIEKVVLNNSEVTLTDKTSYTASFDYDTMKDSNDMKVFFVAKTVVEKEKTNNIEPVIPVLTPTEVTPPPSTVVNKTDLQSNYDESIKLNENDYTVISWTTFKDKLDDAKLVLDNENATQEQVNNAKSALSNAKTNLVKRANKEMLKTLIENAQITKDSGKYTPTSLKVLDTAITVAKTVSDDVNATEESVTKVYKELEVAIQGLVELGDKTTLTQLIKEAKALDLSKYTDESINVLKEVLTYAQKVLEDKDATTTQIEKCVKTIKNAMSSLEYKTTDDNPPNEQQPSDDTSNGDKDVTNNGGNPSSENINTGDVSNITLWTSLLIGSVCLLFLTVRRSLKNK